MARRVAQTGSTLCAGKDLVQTADRQRSPASWALQRDKHRVGAQPGWSLSLQVGLHRDEEACRNRDQSLMTALPVGDEHPMLSDPQILHPQPQHLTAPQPTQHHRRHHGPVPVSARFFVAVQAYLEAERPPGLSTDAVFVALKGPARGRPLAVRGLDEILAGAKRRAGLSHATCHELRHTCLTRLREAGMALEAVQAQAGHASIESTRIYLHLADDWLASQYRKAAEVIDAQVFADHPNQRSPR